MSLFERTRSKDRFFCSGEGKENRKFICVGIRVADERESAGVRQLCIAKQEPDNVCSKKPVVAEIDGHAYGLEVYRTSFRRLDWLHVGDYPCRRTKHGFEFQYQDGGKTHTREFNIVSEE